MTALFEMKPEDRTLDLSFASVAYWPTTFNMRCSARQVYLFITDENGVGHGLHQMVPAQDGQWKVVLKLKTGAYRYRYFADHGSVTTYIRPDEVDVIPRTMDGFDAILTVPADAQLVFQ